MRAIWRNIPPPHTSYGDGPTYCARWVRHSVFVPRFTPPPLQQGPRSLCLCPFSRCKQGSDECASSPCLRGGQCQDLAGQFCCLCSPAFEGDRCELDVSGLPSCLPAAVAEPLPAAFLPPTAHEPPARGGRGGHGETGNVVSTVPPQKPGPSRPHSLQISENRPTHQPTNPPTPPPPTHTEKPRKRK